jgi:ABC-2 type transport system permease protein
MIDDIRTIMWKESKSFLRVRGSKTRTVLTLLSPIFIAVWLPWDSGTDWTEGYLSLILAVIAPVIIAGITVPDSFAGEKERHTLPALLASRLPDRAILFGKMLFGVLVAWLAAFFMLFISLVVANISSWQGQFHFYNPSVFATDMLFSLLLALLTTSAGILISMRAQTAQEASQLLISMLMMPPLILGVLFTTMATRNRGMLDNLDGELVLLIAALVLLVLNIGMLAAAMNRFQRAKLVFD